MNKAVGVLALFVMIVGAPIGTTHAEAKTLYLCDDGKAVLLTDNDGLSCPEYSPQEDLIIVPEGSTMRDVRWAVATQRPESFQPRTAQETRRPVDACMAWHDLNLRTYGGLDMETAEQTRLWLALSRIVTATDLCDEYLTRQIYPNF